MIHRRALLAAGIAIALTFATNAGAQNYPDKPIKMIVPFPPGGPIDAMARLTGQDMTARLDVWSAIVRRLLADRSLDEDARLHAFVEEAVLDLSRKLGEQEAERYGRAGRLDYSWQGLSRYWRKRNEQVRS